MEVMEDGNLMDKVHILIQRDMEYYNDKQTILQETICPGIVGGKLDFPRSASFASMKIVLWWEEEYVAAFRKSSGFLQENDTSDENLEASGGCGGIVKASDPGKFVSLINKSADEFLDHLHVLTQEALDHADLTVLTGTIGAAALLKNCLWFYIQSVTGMKSKDMDMLQSSYKKYSEMTEALAERLLDLHSRLLSLYILQEPESLDWENDKSFCELERGSYIIQMWWLYMQGTKEDLWTTVPPKMAQRVFAGMLNESLTILTVRYTQAYPTEARAHLLIVDISNLLLCVAQLLPSICENADEFIGLSLNNKNKILRDIHTKCQELLNCLVLRGSPLDVLHKVFRKGIENVPIFKSKSVGPAPWIIFSLPHIFKDLPKHITSSTELSPNSIVALELIVLLAQPQPDWALLIKILQMKNCEILKYILLFALENYNVELLRSTVKSNNCGLFLCPSDGSCDNIDTSTTILTPSHYYNLIMSATNVILNINHNLDDLLDIFITSICKKSDWAKCFDRRNVWNQIRPPWYEAFIDFVQPILPIITKTTINALQTGASMYQAMLIVLICFSQLWDTISESLPKFALMLQEILPPNIMPLSNSALLQIIISALYTEFLKLSSNSQKSVSFNNNVSYSSSKYKQSSPDSSNTVRDNPNSVESISLAVAESLCSIDEDNKHTDQIEEFLEQVNDNLELSQQLEMNKIKSTILIPEITVSDILMSTSGKRSLKVLYYFIKTNKDWLFQKLNISDEKEIIIPNKVVSSSAPLLHIMFHIGSRPFDQLLSGEWQPDWIDLLQTPTGLSVDRVWSQISLRWDFRDVNSSSLSTRDIQIINNLTSLLKQS